MLQREHSLQHAKYFRVVLAALSGFFHAVQKEELVTLVVYSFVIHSLING
ncbi:hypothetical protein [Parapedobacter indicus]|uniref:Uncharacterized protein n=1 Tax=Parapedobacter indicus TaxID=1477437 RepID=A0A1I3IJX8_9SPHI|nr:hypothetical protein [Parapedobacter indicus]PPL02197.1 hypothetical protein CLV26_104122 [Parapedobacter indicus]SFI48190.1 hypothetical protein SAMN05444682_104122 [Parapedobacter indicus]